jgi:hypothetical protein
MHLRAGHEYIAAGMFVKVKYVLKNNMNLALKNVSQRLKIHLEKSVEGFSLNFVLINVLAYLFDFF